MTIVYKVTTSFNSMAVLLGKSDITAGRTMNALTTELNVSRKKN
jgi:hypothetical protein